MPEKNINLHILLATKRLIPFVDVINQEFKKSIALITSKLPVTDIDVVVSDNPDGAVPGYALGFKIVKDYLEKHPDMKASTLYSEKASCFV